MNNDHPRDHIIVAVFDTWSLFRGETLRLKCMKMREGVSAIIQSCGIYERPLSLVLTDHCSVAEKELMKLCRKRRKKTSESDDKTSDNRR